MRLTRVFAAAALWILLGSAGSAAAASTVTLDIRSGSLYVVNSLGVPLGAVNVLVEGATGFTFNAALPGISVADSVYSVRPISGSPWDALIINNLALGVTLVPAGGDVRMGSFAAGDVPILFPGETPDPTGPGTVLAGTIFDVNGYVISISSYQRTGGCDIAGCFGLGGLVLVVPEPAAIPAAVTILCLAYVLGGKIRRRSGSVAAPT